jgi:hypothetical protein
MRHQGLCIQFAASRVFQADLDITRSAGAWRLT